MKYKESPIGMRFKQIRNEARMTQTAFGDCLGVTHAHISKIESGIERPSKTLKLLLAKEFLINYEWIDEGTGEMYSKEDRERLYVIAEMFKCRDELREMVDSLHDLIYARFIYGRQGQ